MPHVPFAPIEEPARREKRRIVTFDLEWYPAGERELEPRIFGLYDGVRYRSFPGKHEGVSGSGRGMELFLQELFHPRNEGAWMYAHFGGGADFTFLLEEIIKRPRVRVSGFSSGSSLVVLRVSKGHHTWTLIDSYSLLRDKLAHIAHSVGEKKTRSSFRCPSYPACGHVGRICLSAPDCGCDVGPEPLCMFYAPYSILRDYNEQDCRILHKGITRFQNEIFDELGSELGITAAATAMRLFRRQYMTRPIAPLAHDVSSWIAQGYFSGRVDVFRPSSADPLHEWDVNAAYPDAMTKPTPGSLTRTLRRIPQGDSRLYFAQAVVHVPKMFLPPLAKRGAVDGRTYYPTGTWEGVFSRPDLELLEEAGGRIERVSEVKVFEPSYDWADYVHELYELRFATRDPFLVSLRKLLMNAPYGKMAEGMTKASLHIHPASGHRCPHEEGKHEVDGEDGIRRATCVEELFPGAILVTDTRVVPHRHVAGAAHIAAEAKRTLYRYMQPCGEDLFYCDTDGFYTHRHFEESAELGGLKRKRTCEPPNIFDGPKFYLANHEARTKGFPHMTEEQYLAARTGAPVHVERMARPREMARLEGDIRPQMLSFDKRVMLDHYRPKRRAAGENLTEPWTAKDTDAPWKRRTAAADFLDAIDPNKRGEK
jgi:hypothetical protein